MGGSVPLYMIDEILHVPTITVPIANHDNNQHSFNENIRIQNFMGRNRVAGSVAGYVRAPTPSRSRFGSARCYRTATVREPVPFSLSY